MKRLVLVLAASVLLLSCEDPVREQRAESLGPDQGPYEEGPLHRAGDPCTWCHTKGGDSPHLDLAGTVYARRDSKDALGGVKVRLFDGQGQEQTLVSNEAGSFFFSEGDLALKFPIWVKLEYQGEVTAMQTPILRERSCAACHRHSTSPSSPGHVYLWEEP